jgi:parallel beta-helix repeat protein
MVTGNTLAGDEDGVDIVDSTNNTVSSNTIARSLSDGIFVRGGTNTIVNNTVSDSGDRGIWLRGDLFDTTGCKVNGNKVNDSHLYGIELDGDGLGEGDSVMVLKNSVSENGTSAFT